MANQDVLGHDKTCLLEVDKGDCNCYLSWMSNIQTRTEFLPLTTEAPHGELGVIDGNARLDLDGFIWLKKLRERERHSRADNQAILQSNPVYGALEDGEIRILELYPAESGSPLSGKLHVASIDFEYPKEGDWRSWRRTTNHAVSLERSGPFWYTALSYVWGVPKFDVKFQLDDNHLQITESLAGALQHLRDEKQSVFLWIDQICINQADVAEKVKQIPLMGKIYSHATNCVIWLGDAEGSNADLAFQTLETVHSRLGLSDVEVTPADFERLVLPDPDHVAWWEIKQLFRRPWFTRLWTIQEVMLPRTVHVKWGPASASWDDLAGWCATLKSSGLLQWLERNHDMDREHMPNKELELAPATGGRTANELEMLKTAVSQGFYSLLDLLVGTRYAQATEPKDKIYGMLGLLDIDITPTYAKEVTTRQVFAQASLKIGPTDLYRLFNCVDHEVPVRPTWVPDWSSPRVTSSLGYSTMSWTVYAAGGRHSDPSRGLKYPFVVPVTVDEPGNHLLENPYVLPVTVYEPDPVITMRGKIFDVVSTIGRVATDATVDIDNPLQKNRDWISYVDIAERFEQYPTEDTVFDAFWQTLVAGMNASGREKAPADYSEVFSLVIDSSTGNMPSLPGQTYTPRREKGFFTLESLRSRKPVKTLEELRQSLRSALRNRRFAVLDKGYFALVPRGTVAGDLICVLEGVNVPYVVRSAEDGEHEYELVGECYVHGIMEGEVMAMDEISFHDIRIV